MFFPLLYNPSEKERERLQNIQDAITYSHQNMRSQAKNAYDYMAKKQAFYRRVRSNIKLIKN